MDWLNEIALSPQAAALRRTLSPSEFKNYQQSIEHLAMTTDRPVVEVADRMLRGVADMLNGDGTDTFLGLINDICDENDR